VRKDMYPTCHQYIIMTWDEVIFASAKGRQ
jgi:hypothetical protein